MIKLHSNWKHLKDKNDKFTYNDVVKKISKAASINVPSNWELEGLHNYNGSVWYVNTFSINLKILKPGIKNLVFSGVDYFADVYLNGELLGSHEGYFQKFFFDITGKLKDENILAVKVNSPKEEPVTVWPLKKNLIKGIFNHHDCRPGGWSYKFGQDKNTGGIWNDVYIEEFECGFFEQVKISSQIDFKKDFADVIIDLKAVSPVKLDKKDKILIEVVGPDKKRVEKSFLVSAGKGTTNHLLKLRIENPKLWFPSDIGKPELYMLKINSENFGKYSSNFGIREVKLVDEVFYINGKRLFLRGTNVIPEQFLSTLSKDRIAKQIELMKDANLNIVRIHAHVNRQEYYNECDKQGIMVWQDFPLQWTYSDSEDFKNNAVSQIKDMVNQLFNHPSISFWCCHNEPGLQIKTLDPALFKAVASQDLSRIIRMASNYEEHAYDGWYWGKKEHYAAVPMGPLVTEFGAQALPNVESLKKILPEKAVYPPDYETWTYHNFQPDQTFNVAQINPGNSLVEFVQNSQIYQSELIKSAIDFYRRKKFTGINGVFQFMLIDCWPSITWSVVDYYGIPKDGYYALKNVFQPVYVSVRSRQDKYFPDKKLQIDLWLINDKHEKYPECSIKVVSGGKVLGTIDYGQLESDSVCFINYELIDISLKGLKKGRHIVEFYLVSKKKIISSNSIEIEVVNNV